MSEQFRIAAREAALKLGETTDARVFLEKPFSGFFVTQERKGNPFTTFSSKDLFGKEGENILVFCESLLGQKH